MVLSSPSAVPLLFSYLVFLYLQVVVMFICLLAFYIFRIEESLSSLLDVCWLAVNRVLYFYVDKFKLTISF